MRIRKPIALILLALLGFLLGYFNDNLVNFCLDKNTYIGVLTMLLFLSISMTLFFHGKSQTERAKRDNYDETSYEFRENTRRSINGLNDKLIEIESYVRLSDRKHDATLEKVIQYGSSLNKHRTNK